MRITSYGSGSVAVTAIVCLIIFIAGALLQSGGGIVLSASAALYFAFCLFFYRDPERTAPDDPDAILAPADGKVLLVRQVEHPLTGEPSTLVSIFMSPFNVHVNRIPAGGSVSHLRYHPGRFLMAFDHRSMTDNERMEIGVACAFGSLWFCQVSGFLARRIVCRLDLGQKVTAGIRFGMIKFGSRVDIVFPASVSVSVTTGMRTVAGQTVMGRTKRRF
ncbi:MAG: phosphatidylserine decarboxylase [Chlorobiaceae bacterium]|nr:phosphatidylserine decarboxylase [Chlorobiaceae bacterium]